MSPLSFPWIDHHFQVFVSTGMSDVMPGFFPALSQDTSNFSQLPFRRKSRLSTPPIGSEIDGPLIFHCDWMKWVVDQGASKCLWLGVR